jgi:hypothetical protein
MKIATTALVLLCPALAFADESKPERVATADPAETPVYEPTMDGSMAPGMVPVKPIAEQPKAAEDPILAHQRVAGSGQGLYAGTALTTPANKVQLSFASIPPFGGTLTLSTGLGATTELSATVGGTIEDAEGLSGFGVGIKQIIGRGNNWAFALAGSVYQVGEGGRDAETLYSVSALASACSDERCGVLISGGIHMVGISGEQDTLTMVSLGLSAGSKTTRFLAEIMAGGPSGEDSAAFAMVGVRLGGKRTAVDLGLVTLLGENSDVPFLPMLNIHTRL